MVVLRLSSRLLLVSFQYYFSAVLENACQHHDFPDTLEWAKLKDAHFNSRQHEHFLNVLLVRKHINYFNFLVFCVSLIHKLHKEPLIGYGSVGPLWLWQFLKPIWKLIPNF